MKNRKSSRSSHSSRKSTKSSRRLMATYLTVVCPTCGSFVGKECIHTSRAKRGKNRHEPHTDRVRLAKVELNAEDRSKVDNFDSDVVAPKRKNPKEKLTDEQKCIVNILSEKIEVLGKHADFVGPVTVGPLISTYRFLPVRRTKVSHIEALYKDFAVALGAENIVVKRMPGESAVGIFVPNKERKLIQFRDTIRNVADYMQEIPEDKHQKIPLNFGMDSNGDPFIDDLTQQPHLLIAGTTGGGKSTLEHGLVETISWVCSPEEVKIFISDTKGVEFRAFQHLPHLWKPIATDPYMTMGAFQEAIQLTQDRLDLIGAAGVRNIHEYNQVVPEEKRMFFLVIIIDELADLLGNSLERAEAAANSAKLSTIVARSRASGIHVIAATQRPDVRLVKGAIKANFPTRLTFRLPSPADSRTVLNTKGAEGLMSKGDMFYSSSMSPELKRLHAPYTSIQDTRLMIEHIIKREVDRKAERENSFVKDGGDSETQVSWKN